MTPGDFMQAALAYCTRVEGSVTSWYRTPKRNQAVGGVRLSKHLLGLAVDVVLDDPAVYPEDERRRIAEQLGLVLIVESTHDHLQVSS